MADGHQRHDEPGLLEHRSCRKGGLIAAAAIVRIRAVAAIGVLVGASALGAALFYAVYGSL